MKAALAVWAGVMALLIALFVGVVYSDEGGGGDEHGPPVVEQVQVR